MERRLEKSRELLLKLDADTLNQRSRRLSMLPTMTFSGKIPDRTFRLLSEADLCFINGEFNACISVLATAVEYS